MKLYDTHFHLDLQKDISAAINEINSNQIYTIAMTNLPVLYEKELRKYESSYIRIALGFHPELIADIEMSNYPFSVNWLSDVGMMKQKFSQYILERQKKK